MFPTKILKSKEFHIMEVKKYGLRVITPDNSEIIDKIELGGYKNEENKKKFFFPYRTPFFNHKKLMENAYQNETLKKKRCVDASVFQQLVTTDGSNDFMKIHVMKTKFYLIFQRSCKKTQSSFPSFFIS